MSSFYVYVFSSIDCSTVCSISAKYPRGPQLVICDYGLGPCVDVASIEDPVYAEWRDALEALEPFSSRTPQEVTITEY